MQKQRITDNGDRAVVAEGHGFSGFAAVKAEVRVDQ
jgi:hypothetical protein